jgi:hypothetical protein
LSAGAEVRVRREGANPLRLAAPVGSCQDCRQWDIESADAVRTFEEAHRGCAADDGDELFRIRPDGVDGTGDFSRKSPRA